MDDLEQRIRRLGASGTFGGLNYEPHRRWSGGAWSAIWWPEGQRGNPFCGHDVRGNDPVTILDDLIEQTVRWLRLHKYTVQWERERKAEERRARAGWAGMTGRLP